MPQPTRRNLEAAARRLGCSISYGLAEFVVSAPYGMEFAATETIQLIANETNTESELRRDWYELLITDLSSGLRDRTDM